MGHDFPIVPKNERVELETSSRWTAWFDDEGVHIKQVAGSDHEWKWEDVADLKLVAPTSTSRVWSILQAILELLSPVSLRSHELRLEVETWREGWKILELGAGKNAPYDYRTLDALEALLDLFSETKQLRRLGSAADISEALPDLLRLRSWVTPVTHWRVRREFKERL